MKLFRKSKPVKNPAPTKLPLSNSVILENGALSMASSPFPELNTVLDKIIQVTPIYHTQGHYILGLSENGNCYAFDPIRMKWEPQVESPLFGDYFGNLIQI